MTSDRYRVLAAFAVFLTVSLPAGGVDYAPDAFVRADIVTDPSPGRFSVCHGGTCALVSQVALDPNEWASVTAIFARPPADAQEERERIAEAIARFETLVGAITDTSDDRAENRFGKAWWSQMDCIDESTNSTTYLRILSASGLLRFHRAEARATRGFFVFGWPHMTAVVQERGNGSRWAVDSWFFENGVPPVVVPLELWRKGWRPEKPPVTRAL